MPTLDSTGLTIDTQEDIKAAIEVSELSNIDSELNVTASSVIGQLNAIFAQKLAELNELLQGIYDCLNPDSATGNELDNIAALCPGIERNSAASATLTATCTLTAGTYAAGTLVMRSGTYPTLRYKNDAEVVSGGGAVTGIAFTAESSGAAYNIVLADLDEIAQPVTGWTAVAATTDASGGLDAESDYDFRLRRAQEIRRSGSSHADAIAADVLEVEDVLSVAVEENDTDTATATCAAHGIHVVYWDGAGHTASTAELTQAIFDSKSAGIATSGASSEVVTDSMGFSHTINFDVASEKRLIIAISTITYSDDAPINAEDLLKQKLVSFIEGGLDVDDTTTIDGLDIGDDVIYAKIYACALSIPWIDDMTSFEIAWFGDAPGVANLTVASDEIAQLDSGDISIT